MRLVCGGVLSRLEDCKRVRVIPQTTEGRLPVRPLSILVAETDPCDALLLEQSFFEAGLEGSTAFVDDGQETIDYLSGEPPFDNRLAHPVPTLLLLNLDLPRTSGFEVLRWLQRKPILNRTQVVMFSSSRKHEDVHRSYALGADAYLLKPSNPDELMNVGAYLKNYWIEMGPGT